MADERILIIRLGAMGDILHTLPAAASLKKSSKNRKIAWLVASKWKPLLEGNPFIDELIPFDRRGLARNLETWRDVRKIRPEIAIDFQGLVQSAIAGRMSGPRELLGFDRSVAREPLASRCYTRAVHVTGPHRIERNLQLAQAAGATELTYDAWIPQGSPEGDLPAQPFVLASPFAGWQSKQWPLTLYEKLGEYLNDEGWRLVLNVPAERAGDVRALQHVEVHVSSLVGLIDATRRATAVLGVDSGPLHLAVALKKPGVALYGLTDPAQTGPFRSSFTVIRQHGVENTYKRGSAIHSSMSSISVDEVCSALLLSVVDAKAQVRSAVRL